MRILLTKLWAYAVETVCAIVLCAIIWLTIGADEVAAWQIQKRPDLLVSIGIGAAVSGTIFAAYFALLSTEFGRKLRVHGVAVEYAAAFAFPMALLVMVAGTLEFSDKNTNLLLSRFITFLLCYSCVNCVTMIKNVIGLVHLWQDVDRSTEARSLQGKGDA